MTIPTLALRDGTSIPQIGFGTFKVDPADTERVVAEALELGYRHIDTAAIYRNEEGVGRAIAQSGIPRDELYVTTKLWDDRHEDAPAALAESLEKLQLDRVDLYLIHWPAPAQGKALVAWDALQGLQAEGLTTSIGVSNFDERFLPDVIASGAIPVIDQIELHPQFQQRATQALAAEHDITIEAWGPLGQGKVDYEQTVIGDIARRIGATWAQVTLAWHLQQGRIVFPKSTKRERILENLQSVNVSLTPEDLAAIDALDLGAAGRVSADPAER